MVLRGAWGLLAVVLMVAIGAGVWLARLPQVSGEAVTVDAADAQQSGWARMAFEAGQGAVFHAEGDTGHGGVSFDRLFRLAGTFGLGGDGEPEERQAIVEVLESGRQEIVGVGDVLVGVQVLAVLTDHVLLRGPAGRGELYLGRYEGRGSGSVSGVEDDHGGESGGGATAESRFGRQVSTNMWAFNRDAVEAYYGELMENPDRLLQVFDSLKPLRDENERITGYRLGIEGEAEFFSAVGMEEGDVVRRVNGIPMTNRRRAEFLIRRFAENKLNAFALDIERGGKEQRLVYSLR
jgi:type II secretory pathway component PulC